MKIFKELVIVNKIPNKFPSNYRVYRRFGIPYLGNGFRLEPISCDDQSAPKIVAHNKSGQKDLKIIIYLLF